MRALIYLAIAVTISAYSGLVCSQGITDSAPSDTNADSGVGFKTVSEALETLKAKPGVSVNFTKPDNWTIISEPDGKAVWSFTPPTHYAYPAVVKREIKVHANGGVYIETRALCQAEKVACDRLLEEFNQLNNRARSAVQQRLNKNAEPQ